MKRLLGIKSRTERRERIEEILRKVDLGKEYLFRKATQLSGGEMQRAAVARAFAITPDLIICDEPTSALDPEMIKEVLDVMLDLAKEGMTMVVVSHEMGFARAASDKMVFLADGRVIEEGTPEELFEAPKEPRTQQFFEQILV